MINRILLVAAREYRQIASTRSFWVTLLILPLVFAIAPLVSRFFDKSNTQQLMLIDHTGGRVANEIAQRVDLDYDRTILIALSRYVERHHLERADPAAAWASHERLYGDIEVANFVANGGQRTAIAKIALIKPADIPAFNPPEPDFRITPLPASIAAMPDAGIDTALKLLLKPADSIHVKPLNYALLIPADFGRSPVVKLWADGKPSPTLVMALQQTLGQDLKFRYLQANGVAPSTIASAATIAPAITVISPPQGSGREQVVIRSILPLACAYILLMSLVVAGSWMLQGSVEERSNKLIEAVLACVTPNELMYGKLAGTVAVGLSMIATWVVCGLIAAFATQGEIADMIRPALDPVSSIGAMFTILFFFIAGYLMVSMIFLAIGSMTDSMRDAQGYLTPVLLVITLPTTALIQAVLKGANGFAIEVLTWIPLYTPFAVLARLGTGMPAWEVVGSGATLTAFIALEFVVIGRVFRASLLSSGQRLSFKSITKALRPLISLHRP